MEMKKKKTCKNYKKMVPLLRITRARFQGVMGILHTEELI